MVTVALAAAGCSLAIPRLAFAQGSYPATSPGPGSMEIGGGAAWTQGFDLGEQPAELTRNPGAGSGPLTVFRSSTELVPSAGAHAQLAVYLTRSVAVEAGLNYSRPLLRTTLSSDAEEAADVVASETLTRYVIEGSALFHLQGLSFAGGRGVPFLIGGGGYIRELHEDNELVETGQEFHAGGGVKIWFGASRRLGFRGQAVVSVRDGGFDFDDGRRAVPAVSAMLFYRF